MNEFTERMTREHVDAVHKAQFLPSDARAEWFADVFTYLATIVGVCALVGARGDKKTMSEVLEAHSALCFEEATRVRIAVEKKAGKS